MEKKKLLSISLLVSNRPDTVEKCLKSLEHLRKSVSSELILVDTGCGEKVRNIIELYADKIVEFTWCGDFAKARNAGLKEATGEWFLYLDDDEWFEDTSEIEEFFLSGEWKNYGYAFYKQRNYDDMSGSVYSDALVTRMTRLYENVCFVYSIHECFENIRGNIKIFNAYVHHYGYIYKSKKELYEHSRRNIKPLLEEHKCNPKELRHNVQLAQEYDVIQEYRKSIEVSLEGINQAGVEIRYVNSLFANVVKCFYWLCDYSKTIEYGKKYLRDERINELCAAAIYSTLCKANYELGNYMECLDDLRQYLAAYDRNSNGNSYIKYTSLFLDCFEIKELNSDIGFGIRAALCLNNIKKARELFDRIDYHDKTLFVDYEAIKDIIQKFIQEDAEDYHYMLDTMIKNANLTVAVVDIIEEKRKREPQIFKKTSYKWRTYASDDWYFKYLTFWTDPLRENTEQYQEIWDEPERTLPLSVEYGIWDMAEQCNIDIADIICNVPFYKWQRAAEKVCLKSPWKDVQKINEKVKRLDTDQDHLIWWNICYEKRAFSEMDGTKDLADSEIGQIRSAWKKYAADSRKLFQKIYKQELFDERSMILPECCQISFQLQDFFQKEEQQDYLALVEILKEIRKMSSDFAIQVKYYLKYIEDLMKAKETEQKSAQNELHRMAQQIRPKIEELIQMHREVEALAVIRQIRQLLPDDTEIADMEKKLQAFLKD